LTRITEELDWKPQIGIDHGLQVIF